MTGPVYVIWPVQRDVRPTMAKAGLADLAAYGPSAAVYDFKWRDAQRPAT